jgi:hypothetical protein
METSAKLESMIIKIYIAIRGKTLNVSKAGNKIIVLDITF